MKKGAYSHLSEKNHNCPRFVFTLLCVHVTYSLPYPVPRPPPPTHILPCIYNHPPFQALYFDNCDHLHWAGLHSFLARRLWRFAFKSKNQKNSPEKWIIPPAKVSVINHKRKLAMHINRVQRIGWVLLIHYPPWTPPPTPYRKTGDTRTAAIPDPGSMGLETRWITNCERCWARVLA